MTDVGRRIEHISSDSDFKVSLSSLDHNYNTMSPKVFFITGTSTGFGAELVKYVLSKGDIAVATARNPAKLEGNFKGTNDKNYLAVALDVTDKKSIDTAFDAAIKKFGRVDVVVNK